MQRLRAHLRSRPRAVVLLLALVLAVRLIVPAGFMPVVDRGRVSLQLCSGMVEPAAPVSAMPGMAHHSSPDADHGKPEMPCAFAALGLAATGGADAALLLAAILFVFVLAARTVARPSPAPTRRLRPPLRAPPVTA